MPSLFRSPLVAFLVVAITVAALLLRFAPTSRPEVEVTSPPTSDAIPNTPIPSQVWPGAVARDVLKGGGRVVKATIQSKERNFVVMVVTLAPGGSAGHVIVWQDDRGTRMQLLQAEGAVGGLASGNSVVIHGVYETRGGRRELGIVYDGSAFGSASPTARLALLRLEGDEWRIIWDSDEIDEWRGSHGDVEFPNGNLSELVVRSDSWSDGYDELSDVLHESNSGPHRYFVDTWVRDGDGYVRSAADTVPAPYATLVEFMYALSIGNEFTARDWVTERDLLAAARDLGLDDGPTKHWLITCHNGIDCGKEEPITFDPRSEHGEPRAAIFFEERDGQWLISDIKPDGGS